MNVERAPRLAWWLWPTVLSLDAPLVAVGWQRVLADVARLRLEWPQPFILAASVWLAYAADRWIEGWRLTPGAIRTARHAFYQRRRWPLFVLWLTVLAADLWVALTRLSRTEFAAGWLVLPPVLAYLLSFRDHQEFHEQCVERIFTDFHRRLAPISLWVEAFFTRRGGLDINPVRSTEPLTRGAQRLIRQ